MFMHPTRRPVPLLLALRRVALLGLVVGALGFASQRQSHAYVSLEVGCLALNIYHEARGEPLDGQVAVVGVTLNRMHSTSYPDTVCGVVWQPHQFSWTRQQVRHPHRDPLAWTSVLAVAERAYAAPRELPLKGATHFHAYQVTPDWSHQLRLVQKIGNHLFYES
jgi:spore germination cell wall hydrolase CwlJ-like protein